MDANGPRQGQLRDAYVPNRRVRLASDVAALCAVGLGLIVGLLGSGLTWWERSELFDLASNSREVVKMGLGLLSTLAMWPVQLEVVQVDRNGIVRAPVRPVAAPPERSPTGP